MFNNFKKLDNKNIFKIIIILLILILPKNKSILNFFIKNIIGRFIYSIILCISSYYNTSISILLTILYIIMIKKNNSSN